MKKIEIFTDGACSGNPGPGGYGAILRYKGTSKELWGGDPSTTNNRMELTAVITALSALKEPCEVELYSDSKYIIEKGLNSDLWEKLLYLLEVHKVNFNWVKGHAGHPENERCDELAVMGSKQYKQN